MERKIINVTGKRQITIPLKYYEKLGLDKEVECILMNDSIIIRSLSESEDNFTMEILKDLVSQGYTGDELIEKFEEQRKNIKKAIKMLIDQADDIARGKQKGATTKEIFGED